MINRWEICFGGFGGQGIVLSSVILGLAAVKDGKFAAQRASYGAEARGGKCKSEVIISDEEISYPLIEHLQTLVIMSQPAYDSYLNELDSGGLMVDPSMVENFEKRTDISIFKIPAVDIADRLGNRIAANMVMLGALQSKLGMVTKESLKHSVCDSVPSRFINLNLKAVDEGEKIATNNSNLLKV
jgi:2-oxoglutarate ferredoxin oxidoreductase subunit gamma